MRVRLTLAYQGTDFAGWQVQDHPGENQPRTVQGCLEDALGRICGAPVRVHGSGRTDAGVHALGQVAHFDAPEERAGLDWLRALNGNLPHDVRVLDAGIADREFHARYSALSKTYTYSLWLSRRYVLPTRRYFVWATGPLDLDAMREAAVFLTGTHDYAAFQNAGTEVGSTVRTVSFIGPAGECSSALSEADQMPEDLSAYECVWSFSADGFLKQMVRNLMGCLVEVGRGKLEPQHVRELLENRDRTLAPACAPACGLTLAQVEYP